MKAAYVSKAQTTQMAEKAALKREEKAMDVAAAHVMMKQCRREEEAERQRELTQYLRVRKYHEEVKRQMEVSEAGRLTVTVSVTVSLLLLQCFVIIFVVIVSS